MTAIGLPILQGTDGDYRLAVLAYSLLGGAFIWALILFRTPMFEWWFINIRANHAIVVKNQLILDRTPDKTETITADSRTAETRITMYPLESMREISSGLRGKFPWEIIVKSVNLQSEILIGTPENQPLIVYTRENIELGILWQITLTPLQGSLVNLSRHTETNIIAVFRGYCNEFLRKEARKRAENDILGDLSSLKQDFEHLFGGPSTVHPLEEYYGVWTNMLQLTSVRRTPRYQESAEAGQVAENISKGLKQLKVGVANSEKLDPNVHLIAGLAIAGKAPRLNPIIIAGLSNAAPKRRRRS